MDWSGFSFIISQQIIILRHVFPDIMVLSPAPISNTEDLLHVFYGGESCADCYMNLNCCQVFVKMFT